MSFGEVEGGWGKRCGDDIQGVAVPAWGKEARLLLDRGRRGRLER